MEYLPQQFGDVYLYRDSALFILESKIGFRLECNMIYETCAFEMSGKNPNPIIICEYFIYFK